MIIFILKCLVLLRLGQSLVTNLGEKWTFTPNLQTMQ